MGTEEKAERKHVVKQLPPPVPVSRQLLRITTINDCFVVFSFCLVLLKTVSVGFFFFCQSDCAGNTLSFFLHKRKWFICV